MTGSETITLRVNGASHQLEIDPQTPLLYVLRNDLDLKAAKYGCGTERCGACKVLIDGVDVPSCQLPAGHVAGLEITTVGGLAEGAELHPLQEAFLEEQAAQCGFCTAGMIIAAQGLLNRQRYPSDDDIRGALRNNLCRCGVYDRVRRAVKLRTGRLETPIHELVAGPPLTESAAAAAPSPSLESHENIDDWIQLNSDRSISVFSGKAELGQGIATALAQIAAEELDVKIGRIRLVNADTGRTPDEGGTTGSRSLETSGSAIRLAAAAARQQLLSLAFEQLDSLTPAGDMQARDGVVSDPLTGKTIDYWALLPDGRFSGHIRPDAPRKNPADYNIVGTSARRLDLLNKVSGGDSYVHDMRLPGMLHARAVRPPGYHARLIAFDREAVARMPGVVELVQDGQFIAVVAEREEQAVAAAERASESATWQFTRTLPEQTAIYDDLREKAAQSQRVLDGVVLDEVAPRQQARDGTDPGLRAVYRRPFHMHASLGPSAALALWSEDSLTVWSHSQAAFTLRGALAQALGLAESQIRVIHSEGAGCYGHNGADDAALDAALVARALPGRPILLQWSRWDEHAWEPYGSAMVMQIQGRLSAAGEVVDWRYDVWSYAHSTRPATGLSTSGLLAAWHLEKPFARQEPRPMAGFHSGAHRNADPIYDFANKRVVRHAVSDSPLRVSALRSLGAYANVFAIESFMDELAAAAALDPLDFRLNHLSDQRACAVLLAAAEKAGWRSRSESKTEDVGWGLALAQYKNLQCYCAIVVKLRVDSGTGDIHFERVLIAADAGQVVNPDGLSNQLEGGFVQAASWTLFEEVKFDAYGIDSVDWESYPILSFANAPKIETVIINRPEFPFLGAGEAAQNPTPAAIANAIYDAVGLRLRDIPFTPEKILAGLCDALP